MLYTSALAKKIESLGKQKDLEEVGLWRQSVVNHLYWVAASTPDGDGDMMVAKWDSLLYHLQNQHTDLPNPLYPACGHPPHSDEQRNKEWLEPSEFLAQSSEGLPPLHPLYAWYCFLNWKKI